MAKELPYFQFEPAEYLTKDISFCSLAAQGLFTNLCAYYWQRRCKMTKTQFLKRLNYPELFDELISEGVIDLDNDDVKIKFLDEQFEVRTNLSKVNSTNGLKGGRPRNENRNESEIKPNQNPNENRNESESKGIRRDKIIKEEIKEDNKNENTSVVPPSLKFDFKKSLLKFGFDPQLVEEWLKIRKTKKAVNTETAFNGFLNEIKKNKSIDPNSILRTCIERSWSGFKSEWLTNINSNQNGINNNQQNGANSADQKITDYTAYVLSAIGRKADGSESKQGHEDGSNDFTEFVSL